MKSPLGTIPADWKLVRLGDLTLKVGSGATPLGGEQVYLANRHRYALIRSQAVHDHYFDSSSLSYITDEDARRLANAEVSAGDVLLNITGDGTTFARASLAPPEVLPACVNQHVSIIRPDANQIAPGFLLAYLTNPKVKTYIESFNAGGSRRAITKGHIESFVIPLPPLREQKAVSSLLELINGKLGLDRKINATLEALMIAVFKDWFVDFGPTRAKVEGRKPYLPGELWDIFPESFDEAGKPQGWKVGVLGDIAENLARTVDPSEVAPDTPYIGLEHMPRRSIALTDWDSAGTVTSGKLSFKVGEFLFGKLRPYFHKVGIAPVDGISSTDIVVCRGRSDLTNAFTLCVISSSEFVRYTDRASTGTKMPRTSWPIMRQFKITLPASAHLMRAFEDFAAPLLDRIVRNVLESRCLVETRDLLLPKVLSGAVRLKDGEQSGEDAL